MYIKLLTKYHLEFLSLKGGCTSLSESIHVKMPHCWKSQVEAQMSFYMRLILRKSVYMHQVLEIGMGEWGLFFGLCM